MSATTATNQQTAPPDAPVIHFADLVNGFVADTDAAAAARASGIPRGIVTQFKDLDSALGGYLAPGVHILQAAPGIGKTAFALQIGVSKYYPTLFVSAEMGLLELFRRTIARETGTFLGKLKDGSISGSAALTLAQAAVAKVPRLKLMDSTQIYAHPNHIQDRADELRRYYQTDHVLIVIDSLHVWARMSKKWDKALSNNTDYELINSALDAASLIAANLNCPVLAIAHRNREGNKSKDGSMHTAKGSGDFEYIAETVIDLMTEKSATPDANGEIELKAHIHKNRHGSAGVSFPLKFSGRLQQFKEL